MIEWFVENKKWLFSGIGVLILSGIIGLVKYVFSKKKTSKSKRTINFNGEKGIYVEKNDGEINIQ
ncbi:MAG: hypothetical protein LBI15_02900 [Dysgonamonadaceae bacterium]|jgi:hypothetical protein|nr:hypothetical protein [Dysgonamonadaceae bacterium]